MDKRLHDLLLRKAKRAGMDHNKFGFVTELVEEAVKKRVARSNGKAVRAKG